MAKINAHGEVKVAEARRTRASEVFSSGGYQSDEVTDVLVLTSGGRILFRSIYPKNRYGRGTSTGYSVRARIKDSVPRADLFEVFKKYAERRDYTVL